MLVFRHAFEISKFCGIRANYTQIGARIIKDTSMPFTSKLTDMRSNEQAKTVDYAA